MCIKLLYDTVTTYAFLDNTVGVERCKKIKLIEILNVILSLLAIITAIFIFFTQKNII